MYWVYILVSEKDKRTYVGYTGNLNNRLKEHNSGRVIATKNRRPFRVLFAEQFENMSDAKLRELWWKSGSGRQKLKEFFNNA